MNRPTLRSLLLEVMCKWQRVKRQWDFISVEIPNLISRSFWKHAFTLRIMTFQRQTRVADATYFVTTTWPHKVLNPSQPAQYTREPSGTGIGLFNTWLQLSTLARGIEWSVKTDLVGQMYCILVTMFRLWKATGNDSYCGKGTERKKLRREKPDNEKWERDTICEREK